MYELIAINEQGASVNYYNKTIKLCLKDFDSQYFRRGFKITIYKNGRLHKQIKKTYK